MAEDSGDTRDAKSHEDDVDSRRFFSKSKTKETKLNASRSGRDETDSDCFRYRMDYPSIGTCLIINNENFHESTGMNIRTGTEFDGSRANEIFSSLGYKTTVVNDQTVAEMKQLLINVSKEDHSKNASFVCVLLSHGEDGMIYGTDGCEKFETLTKCFKGNQCKGLLGKPKLFFIQACRGTNLDEGADIETDSVSESSPVRIPLEADFLYAFSTAPGYFAWRNPSHGSWFIQSLCEALQEFRGQLELMQIMTRVNYKVSRSFESSSGKPGFSGKKQIPCIVSMLTKDFYFP